MKWVPVLICVSRIILAQQPTAEQIVQRSSTAMNGDWKAGPQFSFTEHDVESKHGRAKTVKTFRVLMIDGSTYRELTAIDNEPLSPQLQNAEKRKLAAEIQRRHQETPAERRRRVARFLKERQQDHEMMQQMAKAFDFTLLGEDVLNGHKVWLLNADPNPAYVPSNAETKVLLGMKGRLWVDEEQYHWVKVEAEVMKPVTLFGFLAKVQPGTRFMLEQGPVAPGVWQPSHFSSNVRASALGLIDESSTDDESYSGYTLAGPGN